MPRAPWNCVSARVPRSSSSMAETAIARRAARAYAATSTSPARSSVAINAGCDCAARTASIASGVAAVTTARGKHHQLIPTAVGAACHR